MKTLNKEIELLKAARESSGREFEQVEMTQKELEKQLRQKDWELEDVKAMSHARLDAIKLSPFAFTDPLSRDVTFR